MSEYQEIVRITKRKYDLLESKANLESEIDFLEAEVKKLQILAHNEQADVDNLESNKIKLFFLNLSGKKEEYLAQESAEAKSALQKYENTKAKYESYLAKLDECSAELILLGSCDEILRQTLSFPEDTALITLTQCVKEVSQLCEQIDSLHEALSKVSRLGAFRSGTQSTSGLAGTDDLLIAAERIAQNELNQIKIELQAFYASIQPFGIVLETNDIIRIADDYLTDIYTYALISRRVENVSVVLRQIGFQLARIKPRIEQLQKNQYLKYLRSLLDASKR